MPSTAKATAEPAQDQLNGYRLRDELAQAYAPDNAHERMLVTQIAQTWQRWQKALEVEKNDYLEVIGTNLDQFKAVTRYVTDCERAWRHAVENLERTQRRRVKSHAVAHFLPGSSAHRTGPLPTASRTGGPANNVAGPQVHGPATAAVPDSLSPWPEEQSPVSAVSG